jgi:hypothetical protein
MQVFILHSILVRRVNNLNMIIFAFDWITAMKLKNEALALIKLA